MRVSRGQVTDQSLPSYPILLRLPVLPRCLSPVLLLLYFISAAVVAV